ncbi:hypothetical protein AB4Z42_23485 [Mycobacterium sp. 2YAF39]
MSRDLLAFLVTVGVSARAQLYRMAEPPPGTDTSEYYDPDGRDKPGV